MQARGLEIGIEVTVPQPCRRSRLMKGAGIEIGFGPLRSAPSALRVQQNEVLAVFAFRKRLDAVGAKRNQAKPLVATSPFRIPCGQDCQNLVFAAHRDAETCAKPCCACWEADYISGKLIVRRRKTPSASREARAGLFASRLRSWKAVCPCALQEAVRSRRVR